MKLGLDPRLPTNDSVGPLKLRMYEIFRQLSQQVNGISEGLISANHQAATAAPTTGTWQQGDFVTNSTPTELGLVTRKYVIRGWVCVVSGTPGTWVQSRAATGN